MMSNWIREDGCEDCESPDWHSMPKQFSVTDVEARATWLASPWACLNTMSQCAYTGPEPDPNWSPAARPLNSASDRLTDECLVPLTHW